jgi:hypothetical protein
MNLEIVNNIFGYLKTLYSINKNILQLCGIDVIYDEYGELQKLTLDCIRDIPRVIPYSYDYSTNKLLYKSTDGLLEYQTDITYLKDSYDNILQSNYDFLDKVRIVRNKFEHKMHDIKYGSSGSGTQCLFDIKFNVNNKDISLSASEFIRLMKDLNTLFSKIVKDIEKWCYDNNKIEYRYYQKIARFDFEYFNSIFDSNILRKIGTIMYEF